VACVSARIICRTFAQVFVEQTLACVSVCEIRRGNCVENVGHPGKIHGRPWPTKQKSDDALTRNLPPPVNISIISKYIMRTDKILSSR